MDGCRGYCVDAEGNILWTCPKCWRLLEYDKYIYNFTRDKGRGQKHEPIV
jgi:hypothetical protein